MGAKLIFVNMGSLVKWRGLGYWGDGIILSWTHFRPGR